MLSIAACMLLRPAACGLGVLEMKDVRGRRIQSVPRPPSVFGSEISRRGLDKSGRRHCRRPASSHAPMQQHAADGEGFATHWQTCGGLCVGECMLVSLLLHAPCRGSPMFATIRRAEMDSQTRRLTDGEAWLCGAARGIRREYTGMCASILHRLTQMDVCEHVNNIHSQLFVHWALSFFSPPGRQSVPIGPCDFPFQQRKEKEAGKARQREYRVAIECTHPPGVTALPGCVPPACSTGSCDNPVSLSPCLVQENQDSEEAHS